MTEKLFFSILLLTFSLCFSQTDKPKKGKVLCEDFPLQGIEVLNLNSKKTTKTDLNGDFIILIEAEDSLMFISKEYLFKKIGIKRQDLNNSLVVNLTKKPEQLDEVVVVKKTAFPKVGFDRNIASQLSVEKEAQNPKAIGVYDGTITNGANFIEIGKKIFRLFVKPKEKSNNKISIVKFKEFVLSSKDEDLFNKTLHLQPEEIGLFLEFCDADPKSKEVLFNTNPLKLMNFLLEKNIEFKKLGTQEDK